MVVVEEKGNDTPDALLVDDTEFVCKSVLEV